jgi:hypothetical protein
MKFGCICVYHGAHATPPPLPFLPAIDSVDS